MLKVKGLLTVIVTYCVIVTMLHCDKPSYRGALLLKKESLCLIKDQRINRYLDFFDKLTDQVVEDPMISKI